MNIETQGSAVIVTFDDGVSIAGYFRNALAALDVAEHMRMNVELETSCADTMRRYVNFKQLVGAAEVMACR